MARNIRTVMEPKNIDLTKAGVYVCLQNKADGNYLKGVYLELMPYKNPDAFKKACKEVLRAEDSLLVYFDYEHIPPVYISENWICPELFPLIHLISELPSADQSAFSFWLDTFRPDLGEVTPESLEYCFRYSYQGYFQDQNQFGKYHLCEQLSIKVDSTPVFDLTAYTRNLFSSMFRFRNGYVFKDIK